MGQMKDFLITVHNGGEEAVAAVQRVGEDWRAQLEQAADEIERLRLTDAERAAVEWAVIRLANSGGARVGVAMDDTLAAQRLRKMLDRHASERRTEVK